MNLCIAIFLDFTFSEWNALNQYTGWCDVNLTRRGEGEARAAGRLLAENGIEIDHAFTSVLKRASYTTNMCLNMAGQQLSFEKNCDDVGACLVCCKSHSYIKYVSLFTFNSVGYP
jgi:bisphosphoglycerate-dependent phosphoglycerate mutase family 1